MAEDKWNVRPLEVHGLERSSIWPIELQEINTPGVGEGDTELRAKLFKG